MTMATWLLTRMLLLLQKRALWLHLLLLLTPLHHSCRLRHALPLPLLLWLWS